MEEAGIPPSRSSRRMGDHELGKLLAEGPTRQDREATHVALGNVRTAATRRAVPLLPDFRLPRRQHGPAIFGLFLAGYVRGTPLLEARRRVREDLRVARLARRR